MSKNITIQESGTAKALANISKIKIDDNWVPEDETTRGILGVLANGDYSAADMGYHSFSQVAVYVNEKVVGKDAEGIWIVITVDSSGEFVEHSLPTSIAVTTLPSKITYQSGEKIDIRGITVTAYFDDSTEFGRVNPADLNVSPSTATGTTVTVSWKRHDGVVLSATYNITVE